MNNVQQRITEKYQKIKPLRKLALMLVYAMSLLLMIPIIPFKGFPTFKWWCIDYPLRQRQIMISIFVYASILFYISFGWVYVVLLLIGNICFFSYKMLKRKRPI